MTPFYVAAATIGAGSAAVSVAFVIFLLVRRTQRVSTPEQLQHQDELLYSRIHEARVRLLVNQFALEEQLEDLVANHSITITRGVTSPLDGITYDAPRTITPSPDDVKFRHDTLKAIRRFSQAQLVLPSHYPAEELAKFARSIEQIHLDFGPLARHVRRVHKVKVQPNASLRFRIWLSTVAFVMQLLVGACAFAALLPQGTAARMSPLALRNLVRGFGWTTLDGLPAILVATLVGSFAFLVLAVYGELLSRDR